MAMISMKDILRMAEAANTAVLAFICIDYNMAYSVIKAAEKVNKPAIVMLLPEHHEKCNSFGIKGFAEMVKELGEEAKVPISLHLDHSYDYKSVIRAIRLGFSSVMIDGSSKSLEDNTALTKKVVETAHILGADVEAELGHVGLAAAADGDKREFYTKPETAEQFCRETGIDSLTISIGSAHGVYTETPNLDIVRLKEINAATNTPLVLHGGSGIPHEQLEIAFQNGINKFNVGTELLGVYHQAILNYGEYEADGSEQPFRILELPLFAQERMEQYLIEKLTLSKL